MEVGDAYVSREAGMAPLAFAVARRWSVEALRCS